MICDKKKKQQCREKNPALKASVLLTASNLETEKQNSRENITVRSTIKNTVGPLIHLKGLSVLLLIISARYGPNSLYIAFTACFESKVGLLALLRRSCGCPICRGAQGRTAWGPGLPGLMGASHVSPSPCLAPCLLFCLFVFPSRFFPSWARNTSQFGYVSSCRSGVWRACLLCVGA